MIYSRTYKIIVIALLASLGYVLSTFIKFPINSSLHLSARSLGLV